VDNGSDGEDNDRNASNVLARSDTRRCTAGPLGEARRVDIGLLPAIGPLAGSSIAVVVANSGNLFPIMHRYGVTQLPCPSKKRFPAEEFDNVWVVASTGEGVSLHTDAYGS
jgi:hypothetical protein